MLLLSFRGGLPLEILYGAAETLLATQYPSLGASPVKGRKKFSRDTEYGLVQYYELSEL